MDHAKEKGDQMAEGADDVAFVPMPGDQPVPIRIASSPIDFRDSSLRQTLENVPGCKKLDPALLVPFWLLLNRVIKRGFHNEGFIYSLSTMDPC